MRSELKSILLLTLFSYLMWDYLTIETIAFSTLGFILIAFNIPVHRHLRNFIALAVFVSYVVKYGKVIDPEVGLNFLTSVVILKLLEKESLRDSYMIFFGLILLLSAGSLFEKTLTYVIFFTSSFAILLYDFYGTLLIRSKARELIMGMLWVIPLTCVLFFAVPRIVSPLAFRSSSPSAGEVGYTPNLRISDIESLELNDRPVFQAVLSEQIPPERLYWRGNVLVHTDGWNWNAANANNLNLEKRYDKSEVKDGIHQKIRVFGKEPFLFALDWPEKFLLGGYNIILDDQKMVPLSGSEFRPRYEVLSSQKEIIPEEIPSERHLQLVLSKKQRQWIHEKFPGENLAELQRQITNYFQKEGFQYSLSPGRVNSFQEFMNGNKLGYCAHFASATSIILRSKGIPTRLVSGFMGGNYNRFADFYLITQNDAHVWVEAYDGKSWKRLDPTVWIAPQRITLGTEAFLESVTQGNLGAFGRMKFNVRWLQDATMWFKQWDYRFYQWLEEMDYYGQMAILDQMKIKRKWLYYIIPILIGLFTFAFVWQARRSSKNESLKDFEIVWGEFAEKVQAKGLSLSLVSIKSTEEEIKNWKHPEKEKILNLWTELVRISFSADDVNWKTIRKKFRSIDRLL